MDRPDRTAELVSAAIIATIVVWFALSASECAAEPVSVATPAAFYVGLGAGDLLTTYHAERAGAVEANPFMQSHRVPKKVLQAAALTYLDTLAQKRSKRAAWVLRGLSVAGYAAIYHHNLRTAEQARRGK